VPEIPRTARWHCGFGNLLLNAGAHEDAAAEFSEALSLSGRVSWQAWDGLFRCRKIIKRRDNLSSASVRELLCNAIAAVPPGARYEATRGRMQSKLILHALKDPKADPSVATMLARDAFANNPVDMRVRNLYISAMFAGRDFAAITAVVRDTLKGLQRSTCEHLAKILDLMCDDMVDEIGCALVAECQTGLVFGLAGEKPTIGDHILDMVDFSRDPRVAIELSRFIMRCHPTSCTTAIAVLEYIISQHLMTITEPIGIGRWLPRSSYGGSVGRMLSAAYQRCAMDAAKSPAQGINTTGPRFWIEKMKSLSEAEQAGKSGDEYSLPLSDQFKYDYEVNIGICLRLYDKAAENLWRPYISKQIVFSVDWLQNKDSLSSRPRFDSPRGVIRRCQRIYIYSWLAILLLAAGDKRNSMAAAAVLLDDTATLSPDLFRSTSAYSTYRCHGMCSRRGPGNRKLKWRISPEVWMCMECPGIIFCKDCAALSRGGKLPIYRLCASDHELVRARPVAEEYRGIAAQLDDEGNLEVRPEWAESLRREWSAYI
jgi:hypothetical protein